MLGRPKFVLASGSPRRLSLLNQAGIEPDALRPADVDETPKRGELPRACANRLPRAKADAALKSIQLDDELRGSFILAADTVVAVGRRILPKANLVDEASQSPRLFRDLAGDAEGGVSPAPDRDARALQAAQRGRHPGLYRLRRMARQGRRLRRAGHRRILRGQDGRLLQQ